MQTREEARKYFLPGGPISKVLDGFEPRPGQVEMAEEVADALHEGGRLVAEAGTGVGKSMAYLVPAILTGIERGVPPVVSTHTISLQEQLVGKDIPLLRKIMPEGCRPVLVKGRGNYVCLRRLNATSHGSLSTLFPADAGPRELERIAAWASKAREGSKSELDFVPSQAAWSQVQCESGACLGAECPFSGKCFFLAARKRVFSATLLVVNHSLLLSDLVVRKASRGILPDYDSLIIDEAHTLEQASDEILGTDVSNFAVRMALDALYSPSADRGLFSAPECRSARMEVERARESADRFFSALDSMLERSEDASLRIRAGEIGNSLIPVLTALGATAGLMASASSDSDSGLELKLMQERLADIAARIADVASASSESHAYWIERRGREGRVISLRSAPLRAGDLLSEMLFSRLRTAVLTSATLSIPSQDPFAFFAGRVGLDRYRARTFASPFDFEKQAVLYLSRRMPDPNHPGYTSAVAEKVRDHLLRSGGKAFVLFTSYGLMRQVAEILKPFFAGRPYSVFIQGEDLQRTAMLQRFRDEIDSVLLGTSSFWEGVDVKGESLSNVIITRLPFSVPTHPLTQARIERIRSDGGEPFVEYSLPEAVIRLRQGFGRLIRTSTDTGSVVILDPRILTKRYGSVFLSALPKCRMVVE